MRVETWDVSRPNGVSYMSIDMRFLYEMDTRTLCDSEHENAWGSTQYCDRPSGHTGRHLSLERLSRYPTGVWP